MSALFGPRANTVARVSLAVLGVTVVGGVGATIAYPYTPYFTRQFDAVVQPVQFDHRHHVVDDAIDCRYCHTTVDKGPSAGIPSTELCLGCHAQVWNRSPKLEPVRESYFTGRPIPWIRVHQLPDFVYFDHSAHVNKGIGCVSCHGRVDQMASVEQWAPLNMAWCLDCHRNPAPHVRPLDQVTSATWQPRGDRDGLARELMKKYDVKPRTSCTTCHR